MQKSFFSLFCLLLFAALLAPQSGFGKLVDRNVAIVNGDTITLQEVKSTKIGRASCRERV